MTVFWRVGVAGGSDDGVPDLVQDRLKPVVTVLRKSRGIDSNTATGYLYAVGHAKGAATLIQGLGSVGTLHDSVYFRWTGLSG